MEWMIYGANGYTGKMMVEEAVRRGLRPVLGGRSAAALEEIAQRHGLPVRAFALDNDQAVRSGLNGIGLVLHCAGPFSATCGPMLEACLDVGAHYLDITGEIDVFAHCHAQDARAKEKNIVVLPGSGFDVVPTDCLAAQLKRELPNANSLVLAFEAGGGPSPGTAKTSVEGLGSGGRARIDGKMTRVPLAWKTRSFERDGEQRFAMTIPWGDVYTAFVSTGIPNVEVYMGVPPATAKRLRQLRLLGPLLGLSPVQSLLKAQVAKRVRGPSETTRGKTGCVVWGEARDAQGGEVKRRLRTPNGYEVTVTAALGIVARLLGGERPAGGYYTPSRLMGANYVLGLPGVTLD
ncbi:MAG: saccharopine dehydrogenase NADP-binding domain-containing protein [Arenimonas sp.]|uniref:saccharopine dehydrogenase family protein n=1 Tax=Arenimonas sp. TaxID=1872635 RepID=UPI0025BB0E95|nr:saccharopine dehydrogenase NADP-binding domain-containing protein [Arenimonas sp.]MBW8366666.1 saccharopine dehydrogenase NADP-binding domain-containing protein [Arenimonas sp.]